MFFQGHTVNLQHVTQNYSLMLKKITMALFMAAMFLVQPGNGIQATEQTNQVPITRKGSGGGYNPHAPAVSPFSCYVVSGALYLSSTADVGSVYVEIENLTTGEITTATVSNVQNGVIIPFNADPGLYDLTLTITSSGDQYGGSFNL